MAKKRSLEVKPLLNIPKQARSGAIRRDQAPDVNVIIIHYGPIPSPAPATMVTSTRATVIATEEAIATDTGAPVAKGKNISTSYENNIEMLADASLTFEATHTLPNNRRTYASGPGKPLEDLKKAIHNYLSVQEELARELKFGHGRGS
jgi:hypothetical protein